MSDVYADQFVVVSNSATKFTADPRGKVFVTASHGGVYPARLAASYGVRAAVFNDAGLCKDNSAIAGLDFLESVGIGAAAVSNFSACIGDGRDVFENGILSLVNRPAADAGCVKGMKCREAVELLKHVPAPAHCVPFHHEESRRILRSEFPRIICIDSASLSQEGDDDAIVITGSHGALLGGNKAAALKHNAIAAFYNDAGKGKNDIGVTRLPALDERDIIGGTVAAMSAHIGDALSTYEDGILSCVNNCARHYGAEVDMPLKDFVDALCRKLEHRM
ncbi:MAG: hypothetical protein ACI4NN_00635 [Pyramidobacter sp.]